VLTAEHRAALGDHPAHAACPQDAVAALHKLLLWVPDAAGHRLAELVLAQCPPNQLVLQLFLSRLNCARRWPACCSRCHTPQLLLHPFPIVLMSWNLTKAREAERSQDGFLFSGSGLDSTSGVACADGPAASPSPAPTGPPTVPAAISCCWINNCTIAADCRLLPLLLLLCQNGSTQQSAAC